MFSGWGFILDSVISIMPAFVVEFWYISFAPAFLGFAITLFRHQARWLIIGLLLSLPATFIGSLIVILTCKFG